MTTSKQRLEALEEELTPKQAVLKYLVHFVACNTMEAYFRWAFDDETLAAIKATHQRLGKQAMAGIPKQEATALRRARLKAQREYNGLFQLAYLPVCYIEENRYRWLYEISMLIHGVNGYFREEEAKPWLGGLCQRASQTWADLNGFLALVHHLQATVFDGHPILLPEQQAFLDKQRESLSRCIELLRVVSEDHEGASTSEGVSLSPEDLQAACDSSQARQYERLTLALKLQLLRNEHREDEATQLEKACLKDSFRLG